MWERLWKIKIKSTSKEAGESTPQPTPTADACISWACVSPFGAEREEKWARGDSPSRRRLRRSQAKISLEFGGVEEIGISEETEGVELVGADRIPERAGGDDIGGGEKGVTGLRSSADAGQGLG